MPTIGRLVYSIQANVRDFKEGMVATKKELSTAKRLFHETRSPAQRYGATVTKLNSLLKLGAIDQKTYARSLRQLRADLGLTETRFRRFTRSIMASRAAFWASAAAYAAVGLGLRSLIKTSEEFAQAMASSTAIMGNVTDQQRKKMVETAQQVAFATKFSTKEAAEAYYFLASAGLDVAQSMAALPTVARFAQAGMFDLSLATDLVTDAQSALGLSVKDAAKNLGNMQRVSDVLVKANTLANASVQQFSEALTNKAGASLRIVNKDMEEGVAVLAAFADQGLKGAEAGTALGIVLRDLQTKAIANKRAFQDAGVAVFTSAGVMRNMSAIVADLEKKLAGMSTEQKKATLLQLGFADKSVAYLQALIGTSAKIRQYEEDLRLAAGTTEAVAQQQIPALTKAVNELRAVWEMATIEFGSSLAKSLAGSMDSVGLLGRGIAQLADIVHFFKIAWMGVRVTIQKVYTVITGVIVKFFEAGAAIGKFLGDEAGHRRTLLKHMKTHLDAQQRLGDLHKQFNAELIKDTPGQRFIKNLQKIQQQSKKTGQAVQNITAAATGAGPAAMAGKLSGVFSAGVGKLGGAAGGLIGGLKGQLETLPSLVGNFGGVDLNPRSHSPNTAVLKGSAEAFQLDDSRRMQREDYQATANLWLERIAAGISALVDKEQVTIEEVGLE